MLATLYEPNTNDIVKQFCLPSTENQLYHGHLRLWEQDDAPQQGNIFSLSLSAALSSTC